MINILLVDDHLIVREGIRRIINDIPDMNIISEASNGNEAMELILKNTYDIVLLDISMHILNGLQTLKLIKKHNNKLRYLCSACTLKNNMPCVL